MSTKQPNQANKSHKLNENISGKRSAGNLHATFEEAEAGNERKVTKSITTKEMVWKIQKSLEIARQLSTLLKHAEVTNKDDLAKIIGNEIIIQRAYEELDRFNWNEEELTAYEAIIKKQMDYEATMEQKYDEGKAERNIEIAKNMLKENIDLALISKLTGLTIEKVTKIKLEK